jgi:Spy/CpxP family protein refolding chaperone
MRRGWRSAVLTIGTMVLAAGAALAQGFGFGPIGGGAMMLRMPEVQTELKLTDAQKTKVSEMLEKMREERQSAFQGLQGQGPEAFQKKLAEWRASEEKQVAAILNADQQKRYRQLQFQARGISAVADKPVADELKLTEEQRGKVQAIVGAQRQEMRSLLDGAGGPGNFQELRPKLEALRKQTDEKITALLTEDQKKQWKEMLGPSFTFPAFRLGA